MLRLSTIVFVLASSSAAAQSPAFPLVDRLTTICLNTAHAGLCETVRESFKSDYRAAQAGDYSAQRNIAFCLINGCDGAVTKDPVESCAWRMIIQGTPDTKEPTERESYRNACSGLVNADRKQALARAETMYRAIYDGALPLKKLLKD